MCDPTPSKTSYLDACSSRGVNDNIPVLQMEENLQKARELLDFEFYEEQESFRSEAEQDSRDLIDYEQDEKRISPVKPKDSRSNGWV